MSNPGRKAVHALLVVYGLVLAYVVFGLILNYNVDAGVFFALSFALLFFTLGQSIYEMGARNTIVFLAITGATGFAFEVLGTSSGFPFGRYYYTDFLGTMAFNVPVVVPLLWFVITYITFSQCFSHLGKIFLMPLKRVIGLAAVASFGAVAWDLLVDPMFTRYGYWVWLNDSSVPSLSGVPLSNFVGWFVVAFLMIFVFVVISRKRVMITRRNLIDSRIVYILLLVDGAVANGSLLQYDVIAFGGISMLAFLFASHLVSNNWKEKILKGSAIKQTFPAKGETYGRSA